MYALPFWNENHDGVNFYVSTPEEDFILLNEYKENMRNWATPLRPNAWSGKLAHIAAQLSSTDGNIDQFSLQDGVTLRGKTLVLNSSFMPTSTEGGPQGQK